MAAGIPGMNALEYSLRLSGSQRPSEVPMAQLGHQGQEGTREDQMQLLGQVQGAKGRVLGDRGSGTGRTSGVRHRPAKSPSRWRGWLQPHLPVHRGPPPTSPGGGTAPEMPCGGHRRAGS